MVSIHGDLIKRHRRILRQEIQKLNEQQGESMRLSQKNIDLLLYLNYVRFIHATTMRAQELSNIDCSLEIMPIHWTTAAEEFMERFQLNTSIQNLDVDQE